MTFADSTAHYLNIWSFILKWDGSRCVWAAQEHVAERELYFGGVSDWEQRPAQGPSTMCPGSKVEQNTSHRNI